MIDHVEPDKRSAFLNDIKMKEKDHIITKRFNTLDLCDHLKLSSSKTDNVDYWKRIRTLLVSKGAKNSKVITTEERLDNLEKSASKSSFKCFLEILSISGPFCFISEMVLLGLKKPNFESNRNMYFAMSTSVMVLMVISICCYFNDKYYDKNAKQITDIQIEAVSKTTKSI